MNTFVKVTAVTAVMRVIFLCPILLGPTINPSQSMHSLLKLLLTLDTYIVCTPMAMSCLCPDYWSIHATSHPSAINKPQTQGWPWTIPTSICILTYFGDRYIYSLCNFTLVHSIDDRSAFWNAISTCEEQWYRPIDLDTRLYLDLLWWLVSSISLAFTSYHA